MELTGLVAGVDEVGRGALAGPIFGAAVALLPTWDKPLKDSKQYTALQREQLYSEIIKQPVSVVGVYGIDEIGIQDANKKVMKDSAETLDHHLRSIGMYIRKLLVDGTMEVDFDLPDAVIRYEAKADEHYTCVAAASIVAKHLRDQRMKECAAVYPQYGFAEHVGYYCTSHIEAIKKYGYCPIHRRSYHIKELDGIELPEWSGEAV